MSKIICFNCANVSNGRLSDIENKAGPKLDGKRVKSSVQFAPLDEWKVCSECSTAQRSYMIPSGNDDELPIRTGGLAFVIPTDKLIVNLELDTLSDLDRAKVMRDLQSVVWAYLDEIKIKHLVDMAHIETDVDVY